VAGAFVVFDGVDGAGKGTQIALLAAALTARGRVVHVTAEPSTWPIGAHIRRCLRGELEDPGWAAMALLFAADRVQHVEREIAPKLSEGAIVLCDRYDASSIAYQSALAGEDRDGERMRWIATLNQQAKRPDLTIVLDLDPELAAARRQSRGSPTELYERLELQRRVRANYARIAEVRPHDRIERLDASPSTDEVHARIVALVDSVL
jgi:dTMP kinase